jgi:hypothetical protein
MVDRKPVALLPTEDPAPGFGVDPEVEDRETLIGQLLRMDA